MNNSAINNSLSFARAELERAQQCMDRIELMHDDLQQRRLDAIASRVRDYSKSMTPLLDMTVHAGQTRQTMEALLDSFMEAHVNMIADQEAEEKQEEKQPWQDTVEAAVALQDVMADLLSDGEEPEDVTGPDFVITDDYPVQPNVSGPGEAPKPQGFDWSHDDHLRSTAASDKIEEMHDAYVEALIERGEEQLQDKIWGDMGVEKLDDRPEALSSLLEVLHYPVDMVGRALTENQKTILRSTFTGASQIAGQGVNFGNGPVADAKSFISLARRGYLICTVPGKLVAGQLPVFKITDLGRAFVETNFPHTAKSRRSGKTDAQGNLKDNYEA